MIAACPKCKTRFRIAKERLGGDGVRLRCTQCSTVFRVKAPEEAAARAPAEPTVDAQPTPAPRTLDRDRLVVVAHSDPDACKKIAAALEGWGLQSLMVFDGVEGVLAVQRHLPRAVVLDAALPKMYGFQVCELIKRNESLRSIQVVLVGAIHDESRYRRPPEELYGADVYLEAPDLPDALREALSRFGLPVDASAPSPASPPRPEPAPEVAPRAPEPEPRRGPVATPATPPPPAVEAPRAGGAPRSGDAPVESGGVVPPGLSSPAPADDAVAKAERLARIIVSDVILYNEEKFARAVEAGTVAKTMEPDLAEGRSLFQARVPPEVAAQRDFLREELLRVAKQRGMR